MTVMFNGCSFVENSHLEMESDQWQELYWPALVAPDHDNISASGASNTRIFRTTVDYLYTHDPDTVIIGWTGLDREELPCVNGDRMRLRADCTSFENDQDSQGGRRFHESWYRDNHNDWLSFEQLLRYILIVQDLCRSRGIQCWMFNAFWHNYIAYPSQPLEFNFNVIEQKHFNKHLQDLHHVKSLIAQIDFEQWIWPAKTTLSQWAQRQGLEFESGGHPALSAQQAIADYVISRTQRPTLIN
jgi:hypothetical protein